jgi:hypothetical protein
VLHQARRTQLANGADRMRATVNRTDSPAHDDYAQSGALALWAQAAKWATQLGATEYYGGP